MAGWGGAAWRPGDGGARTWGADPAPGDPGQVRVLAAGARRCAAAVDEQAERLAAVDVAAWRGASAGAFAGWLPAAAGDLRRGATALAAVGGALEGYADALTAAQARARELGQRAAAAAARAERARDEIARAGEAGRAGDAGRAGEAGRSGDLALGVSEGRFTEVLRAVADRDDAEAELHRLRGEAQRVSDGLLDAGRAAAGQVLEACEGLPAPRALGPVAARSDEGGLVDELRQFVQDHEEGLAAVADGLAVVGAVAAVAAVVVPPVAVVAGAAGAVGGLVAVAGSAATVAGGVATVSTVGTAAVKGALVAGTEREVSSLWPEALALGTLGASRLVTAPVRFAPGLAPYTVSGSRAVSLGQPVTTRLRDLPSIWDHGATIGSRELVARSVDFAVQTPAAVAGAVGGVQGGRNLWQRYGPGQPVPQPRSGDRRDDQRPGPRG